jgi:hypothetical protein
MQNASIVPPPQHVWFLVQFVPGMPSAAQLFDAPVGATTRATAASTMAAAVMCISCGVGFSSEYSKTSSELQLLV